MNVSKIIQLDDITANQIAAGEVVERPFSVVKELVENSIDANSTQIKIDVEEGGVKLIRVSDNGYGMNRDDAVMSLQRHATSKIRSFNDLSNINTLGFRGEAMPSIASVSRMTILTCDNDNNDATFLTINAGVIEDLEYVGYSKGTQITVTDLFYNTPARLKFLKSTNTEFTHIVNLVSEYAICYPNIRFELTNNGKQILLSSANGHRINAITAVLGLDIAKNLLSFEIEENLIKIHGYVSKPEQAKGTRKDEYLFVNGRAVKNRSILHAVELPYKNMLGPNKYPVAIIFVEIAPELIDVNVHPTKAEIKFANERSVHSLLYKVVNEVLLNGGGAHSFSLKEPKAIDHSQLAPKSENTNSSFDFYKREEKYSTQSDSTGFIDSLKSEYSSNHNENKIDVEKDISVNMDPFDWTKEKKSVEEYPIEDISNKTEIPVDLNEVKVIAQYKNTYIICECVDGIVFIDQHVAHERVLYNKMIRADYTNNLITPLLIPETINLSVRDASIVNSRLKEIKQVGFDLEPFGNNTFIMRGVPADIKEKDTMNVFKEMVDELSEISTTRHLIIRPEQVLITASCKQAIKAGQRLSHDEMNSLVKELLATDNPFTCPHNRPIIVSISDWEINRKFRRN